MSAFISVVIDVYLQLFNVIVHCHLNQQKALYRLDGDAELLFWIGLNDTAGNFKWVDGSALTKM